MNSDDSFLFILVSVKLFILCCYGLIILCKNHESNRSKNHYYSTTTLFGQPINSSFLDTSVLKSTLSLYGIYRYS